MDHRNGERLKTGPTFTQLRLAVILIAAATAAVLGCWLVLIRGGGSSAAKPTAASVEKIRSLPGAVDHAVYWAGPQPGVTYELTRTKQGYVYIRYLPPGVEVGDKRPNFLTVGTYPKPDAFASIEKAAKRKGEITRRIADGGLAVASPQRPQSVYFAYPGSDLLVEVYAPSAATALRSVVSGAVTPIR
jgi:hypothetical protein